MKKKKKKKKYEKLEIDARLNIFSYLEKQSVLFNEILTNYNQNTNGIMSTYKNLIKIGGKEDNRLIII